MPNNAAGPVILDIAGLELSPAEHDILRHPQVGGVILFARNFASSAQLRALTRQIRETRPQLLICVDHEGGRVQRFKKDFTRLPAMQSLGEVYRHSPADSLVQARALGWLMAAELLAHDVDLSFAPVLDLDAHHSAIIGDRAFAPQPDITCDIAEAFVDGMHDAGMAATGKHFPGHGGVRADSHLELPVDHRTLAAIERHDLVPFARLGSKLDALMSAHIVFPQIDSQLVSFSRVWLRDYLRTQLRYRGVVFSDDLSMEGAAAGGAYLQRAQRALAAGCDLVLVCNNAAGAIEVVEGLESQGMPTPTRGVEQLTKTKTCDLGQLHASARWLAAVKVAQKLINKGKE